MRNNRKIIVGVPVDIYQLEEFNFKIEKELQQPGIKTIFAVNPEKVMLARRDPELFSAMRKADFLIPDGIGVIIGLWLIYGKRVSRITGIKLMEYLLKLVSKKKLKIFLFGSKPQVNKTASENILRRFPSLELVGTEHGYIPEEEYEPLVEKINSLRTDILFVGLGSPKQEKWIHRYKEILNVKICMGIGGTLDVIAGSVQRAPSWLQIMGLEWFYRLIKEPSRFRRQMVLLKFILAVLRERFLR